jgi:rhodanese-like protein
MDGAAPRAPHRRPSFTSGVEWATTEHVHRLRRCVMVPTIRHDPFILAEVLTPGQYERAHLPGAVNLPPDRVTALAATLLPDKHQEIVVYCGGPT